MLKSTISLKLGTNVRHQELTYERKYQVKILNFLEDTGAPVKIAILPVVCIIS